MLKLDTINNRIDKEFCKLKDTYLINEYKECKLVQNDTLCYIIINKYFN